jgi:acyl-CoA synthetase (AMP-forming)/AMP-acid ligase II
MCFPMPPLSSAAKHDGVGASTDERASRFTAFLNEQGVGQATKDPEKSAATFREIDGVRYSFPGDHARVEADGTITLLGRGSSCINTGGEKVYPEEVEEALKLHPSISDCLVVGLPDERFGQRVVAVAAVVAGPRPSYQEVIELAREHLAGYKLPKQMVFTDRVQRSPSGKPDYTWACELARERLDAQTTEPSASGGNAFSD